MAIHYNVKTVTDGLVLALDAANIKSYSGSGATTWSDLSGNSNTGTLVNGVGYVETNGGSLVFNGSSQYGRIPYNANFNLSNTNYTLEGWVNFNTVAVGQIMMSKDTYGVNFDWALTMSNATTLIALSNGTGTNVTATVPTMSAGQWYHIVYTSISGVIRIYLNSVLYATQSMSTSDSSQSYVTLGSSSWNNPSNFTNGKIPVLRVYRVGLSAAEVSQNYNALKSRYIAAPTLPTPTIPIIVPNLVTSGLVLNLDAGNTASYSGSGTTWTDLSGNGNNGTLVGSPTYSSADSGKLVFNGSNYVTVSSLNLSTTNHTIIAIARYTGTGTNARVISSSGVNWLMGWWGTETNKYYANNWVSTYYNGPYNETSWICYAATGDYSADSWTLYRNGITIVAGPNNGGSNGPNGLVIGGGGSSENSACEVGVVLAYNRVLTTAEITQNFEALRGRYGL